MDEELAELRDENARLRDQLADAERQIADLDEHLMALVDVSEQSTLDLARAIVDPNYEKE